MLCSSSVLNFSLDSFLILLELPPALRVENFDRQKEWMEENRRKDNYRPINTANILLDISQQNPVVLKLVKIRIHSDHVESQGMLLHSVFLLNFFTDKSRPSVKQEL